MLTKVQLEKYADVLIWGIETSRAKPYRPHDIILMRFDQQALPLAEVLFRKLTMKKRNVIPRALNTPVMEKDFFTHSDKKLRGFVGSWEKQFFGELNGNIFLSAPSSLTHLKDIDPKKMNEVALARKPLRRIMEKREERGLFGWTLCTIPTEELARRAKLSLKDYTAQIVKACFLNDADPVKRWKQIHRDSTEIKKWLGSLKIRTLRLESENCDLEISVGERRRFLGTSGHNIPSFEIFTSPDWRGTRGRYFANLPSYRSGNYVSGVTLEFREGRLIKSRAHQGGEFLARMASMDEGAGRIGEFSLTDRRFSRIDRFMADTLFDENFGGRHGNSHIAIGASYSDTYDGNPAILTPAMKKRLGFNDSALHWDLVNTEDKRVTAALRNGKTVTIYEKGIFTI
jgi:aminopeptidase